MDPELSQNNEALSAHPAKGLVLHDILLISIMAVLAGCGLIYEYLLSHYAGRVLGAMEQAIFTMIGIMIVAMGFGAFAARKIKSAFTGFAWLELAIAFLGTTSILLIASSIALSQMLPQLIGITYGLPPDLDPQGGFFSFLIKTANLTPYIIGFVLAFFIGMEIPLIARVREHLYGMHLVHNTGTIYGADYIGAGIGAAIWIIFMLSIEITTAAVITATVNLVAGLIFFFRYSEHIRYRHTLLSLHVLVLALVGIIAQYGYEWESELEALLYADQVEYSENTQFQRITLTKRLMGSGKPPVYSFYINGRLQFASNDEHIYHSMLVYPTMLASARHERILVVGGGDGLALRNILRWNPKEVVLLDLDPKVIQLFSQPITVDGKVVNAPLLQLNQASFTDPRVKVVYGDAYNSVNQLINQAKTFDSIIVDLPDPSHPDLNKLYTVRFYSKLKQLLNGDGAMSVQSTSPFHAKKAFISIGKSIREAGFLHVEQYHQNVPSFGEWGFSIATRFGQSAKQRLKKYSQLPLKDEWVTPEIIQGAFAFPAQFYQGTETVLANHLGSHQAYRYHQEAWIRQEGLYSREMSQLNQ